jgi:hypothetical protein
MSFYISYEMVWNKYSLPVEIYVYVVVNFDHLFYSKIYYNIKKRWVMFKISTIKMSHV